jgi:hypothetical protein
MGNRETCHTLRRTIFQLEKNNFSGEGGGGREREKERERATGRDDVREEVKNKVPYFIATK